MKSFESSQTSPFGSFLLVKTFHTVQLKSLLCALLGFLAGVIDMCIPEVSSSTADRLAHGKNGSLSVERVLNWPGGQQEV